VPVIAGGSTLVRGVGAGDGAGEPAVETIEVLAEAAELEPAEFDAVTTTPRRLPTSPLVSGYVAPLAPEMLPLLRRH
jgi:hypothetical protein